MGLSASQARLLLLTAKNDGYELQAQLISNERLLLSQEQELIADEYSDATSNMIYEATTETVETKKDDKKTGSTKKSLSLKTFAQAQCDTSNATDTIETEVSVDTYTLIKDTDTVGGKEVKKTNVSYTQEQYDKLSDEDKAKFEKKEGAGKTKVKTKSEPVDGNMVGFKYGTNTYYAEATFNPEANSDDKAYTVKYWVEDADGNIGPIDEDDPVIRSLNNSGPDGIIQRSLRNGTGALYVQNKEGDDTDTSDVVRQFGDETVKFVRKTAESLTGVTSRYYTEDDAEAQAQYNGAMNRVNAMDKKLENKLNQIETNKKAVETEMESAEQIIKTNEERTFKYFG